MHLSTILTSLALLGLSTALPSDPLPPTELGTPCGADIGDCPTLTCIPLSQNCTVWGASDYKSRPPCRGTCQALDLSKQKIYTLCGGWSRIDDCNEAVERCIADPRHDGACGPSCDGPGICVPLVDDVCGWDTGKTCVEGKECFYGSDDVWTNGVPGGKKGCWEYTSPEDGKKKRQCSGQCFPLRFGSDRYDKTDMEEVLTEEWNGWQGRKGSVKVLA